MTSDLEDALRRAADALPLRVREVLWTSTSVVVSGAGWSLMVMCPLRLRTPQSVLGWESPELEDRLWDLIGLDLEAVDPHGGDPVFVFGGGHRLELFADTDVDPWVLHAPDLIVVGRIPGPRDDRAGSRSPTYHLSSLDSIRLAPVRTVSVRRRIAFDTGKEALLVDVDPGLLGQDLDRADDLVVVGWGELYRTADDAREHRFD